MVHQVVHCWGLRGYCNGIHIFLAVDMKERNGGDLVKRLIIQTILATQYNDRKVSHMVTRLSVLKSQSCSQARAGSTPMGEENWKCRSLSVPRGICLGDQALGHKVVYPDTELLTREEEEEEARQASRFRRYMQSQTRS